MGSQVLDKRWPWLTAAGLVVLIAASTLFDVQLGGIDERPVGTATDIEQLAERSDVNVLFLLVDTLRADRLGMYGYERDTSPDLDLLADRGVVFQRHLAQSSWTKASMASLWSGVYPSRSGVTRFDHVTPEEARLPAEVFAEAGFRTVGLWRNGWVDPSFGFGQGFGIYEKPEGSSRPAGIRVENPTLTTRSTDAGMLRSAEEFLRIFGGERWFLYMHFMDLHEYIYDDETALFGTTYSDVYDNAVRRENNLVGEFLVYLARNGYLENTLIVFASDHGEAFGERGVEGHARRLYRETTEVPFFISFPFRLDPGVVVSTRSRNLDIWPTVLDLLGLPPLEGVDGRSLVPEILGAVRGEEPGADEIHAFAHLDQNWGTPGIGPAATVAVTEGPYRYVLTPSGSDKRVEELFDSSGDPLELRDVIRDNPELVKRLREAVRQHMEDVQPSPWGVEPPTLDIDEINLQQLRALGYALPGA